MTHKYIIHKMIKDSLGNEHALCKNGKHRGINHYRWKSVNCPGCLDRKDWNEKQLAEVARLRKEALDKLR